MNRHSNKLVMPGDGYKWRKYGQKFIKTIRKYRSYFKCQKANCRAKKRAEWSPPAAASEPAAANYLRVVYEGVHTHASISMTTPSPSEYSSQLGTSTSTSAPNSYNLLTQVFGDQTIHLSEEA